MSGIYVPGMEMPKRDVTFLVHVNGNTIDLTPPRKYAEEYHREKTFYKLIPIPDHGRLIDADELRKDWLENGENEYVYDTNSFLASLDEAPTIIPAEEEATRNADR